MVSLLIAIALVALYWMHDIHWPPAQRFLINLRQEDPAKAVLLQRTEDRLKYFLMVLSIAAGFDYLFRLLNVF